MKLRLYMVAGVFGLLFLVIDVLALGGAAASHPAVAKQADAESPLAALYMFLGRNAMRLDWVDEMAGSLSDAAFGAAWPAVAEQPEVALDVMFDNARGKTAALVDVAYWGAPILLLLFVVLVSRRDRGVHLIPSSRR